MPCKSPTGDLKFCKGWQQEGLLRLLLNCLDPDIAKAPADLVAYGGRGKVARYVASLNAIIEALRNLENDETLLVQSGKPVGIYKTHPFAPRVLMAGALLVPKWASWDYFQRLADKGLTSYGQSTAAAWAYIGTQGVLQGTWETFYQVAKKHFGGSLRGKLILTAGLGEMGSAQPLAITASGGVVVIADVKEDIIKKRLLASIIDIRAESLVEAVRLAQKYMAAGEPMSIGVEGNAADVNEYFVNHGITPHVVTDQTPAHDQKSYVPSGLTPEEAQRLREWEPHTYGKMVLETVRRQVEAMLTLQKRGAVAFDYGNNLRGLAFKAGVKNAFSLPGFAAAYIRPLFCEGRGPFRWVALSGDPEDIYRTDEMILSLFSQDNRLSEWLGFAQRRLAFHGLPARVCWLDYRERSIFGRKINDMVRTGELSAPIAITRDHMDAAAVASPFRETEGMKDGSDAVADWPILNVLLNCSSGAALVGLYHGGGVGIGYSIHSGMTIIADGTLEAGKKLEWVLKADPALGILRYADAGYMEAQKHCEDPTFPIKSVPGENSA